MSVRVAGLVGVLVLAAGALVAIGVAPAGATSLVANETQFRNAWINPLETQIDLANDIMFANPCAGTATRSSATPLTVNGHGHTLTLCSNPGNGVLNQSGPGALTVQNITVTGGTAANVGGAIIAGSAVTVTNSTFTNNTAALGEGAFFAVGAVTVTNSTFSTNTANFGSGGAIGSGGAVTVTNSTFTNNTAANGFGGAIGTRSSAAVTVTNSTFTNNTAASGGAIGTNGAVTVAYSTLTGNAAPLGSAVFSGASITSFGSVFVKPSGTGTLCSGTSTSSGYNFANETANSCHLTATGDTSLDANNPLLGALANNRGPTQTQLPQAGSPLIDAIPNVACQTAPLATGITTDQRGLVRPEQTSGKCDIGAVEVQLPPAPAPAAPAAVIVTPRFTG